jgi:transglutaminase-like putative cysteine protease
MNTMLKLADENHPLVRKTAKKLTGSENTVRDKLHKLFYFVREDIKFGFTAKGDLMKASETIQAGIGQCNNKGTLLLALCKAANIPARVHFSLIRKEIQKGIFGGLGYRLLPPLLSHCWIEVEVDGRWRRIDSYINDAAFYRGGLLELKRKGWDTGYSISGTCGNSSAEFNIDDEKFVQMDAVETDHGIWEDPADYFVTNKYQNRPGFFRLWVYRRMVKSLNKTVQRLRGTSRETGLCEISCQGEIIDQKT